MTTSRRSLVPPSRDLVVLAIAMAVAVAAVIAWLGATPVGAADGAQPAPTVTPSPVPTAATTFTLSNGTCDGTGGGGWRVQTFIVNAGVNVGSLPFDQGGTFDRVGTDRDNSNGSIASPLFKGGAPGTGFLPAASPAGLIDPGNLSAFDFSDPGWVLTDGNYQIGFACIDQAAAVRQWWAVVVTIDADASPNPFLTVGTGGATTTTSTSSTTSTTVGGSTTSTTAVGATTTSSTTSTTVAGATTTTLPCPTTTSSTTSTTAAGGTTTSTTAAGGTTTTTAPCVTTTSTTAAGALGSGSTSTTRATSGALGTGSTLPRTGQGLAVAAAVGLVLVLLGRIAYLFGLPGSRR